MTKKRIKLIVFLLFLSVIATFFFPSYRRSLYVTRHVIVFTFISYIAYAIIDSIRNKTFQNSQHIINKKEH